MASVREEYQRRLALASSTIHASFRQKNALLLAIVFCAVLLVTALLLSMFKALCLVLLISAGLAWQQQRTRKVWVRAGRERDFFQSGLDRLSDQWMSVNRTGEEFRRPNHLYQDDLNVVGQDSLFQMLCTTRTEMGAEGLAGLLLDPVPLAETRRRQEAVQELVTRSDLHEQTALLGNTGIPDCSREDVAEWLALTVLQVPRALQLTVAICVTLAFLLSLCVYSKILALQMVWPWMAGLSVLPMVTAGWYRKQVTERLDVLRPLTGSFALLYEGLRLLERQEFHSEQLRSIVGSLHASSASKRLKQLLRIFWWLEQREKPYFMFTVLFTLGTLIVFRAEHWRAQNETAMQEWFDAWATFEALQALACCAYEHPDWTFPELETGTARLTASGLGHPLLATKSCVRNDVGLGKGRPYLFISGSNMAGKSTLLRAIGLNTVLAYAGGPVCAEHFVLTPLWLCASIAVQDELSAGQSRFLAEVQRIGSAVNASREGRSVLFLVDEILSGTNSEDRRLVTTAFLEQMLLGDCIGVLTSHDLLLVKAAPGDAIKHMASSDPTDPLRFDYKLKEGLLQGSSALAIARLAGLLG